PRDKMERIRASNTALLQLHCIGTIILLLDSHVAATGVIIAVQGLFLVLLFVSRHIYVTTSVLTSLIISHTDEIRDISDHTGRIRPALVRANSS
ncbi:MAG: hypothetical protein ACE10A_00665, partial [Acidiferrobacterales bacterium]